MGRTRYKVHETYYPYFITSNVIYGIPIFTDSEVANIILDSLQFLKQKKDLKIYAYCIMENHLHLIAKHNELPKCMQGFKSYTARKVVDHLRERNRKHILKSLEYAKMKSKMNSNYQVWEEGYHPKQIISREMMAQKVEYIHFNPIKRGYVDMPEHWRYSSARNYAGTEGLIEVELFKG